MDAERELESHLFLFSFHESRTPHSLSFSNADGIHDVQIPQRHGHRVISAFTVRCLALDRNVAEWIYPSLQLNPSFSNHPKDDHAEKELMAIGCPKVELMVREDNTNVIRFYERLKYTLDPVVVLSKRLIEDE